MSEERKKGARDKKFSLAIKNIDFNAYRAYKLINEDFSVKKRNPHEILTNEYNPLKYPFGLKEVRFRWQTNKNAGEWYELSGRMNKKVSAPISQERIEKVNKCFESKTMKRKYAENKNAFRTIVPNLNNSFEKIKKSSIKKSSATGSIANLLDVTQDYEIPNKKIKLQKSNVFSMEEEIIRPRKRSVDFGDMAGKLTKNTEWGLYKEKIKNEATSKKLNDMRSSVFKQEVLLSTRKHNPTNNSQIILG